MANSKQIVYLSQAQYAELIANGTITVNGVTVTYDENDIYVTPQAEPVTDVRINGTSIAANGVADIPMATANTAGAIIVGDGLQKGSTKLLTNPANNAQIKAGIKPYEPIVPSTQHASTFYGLAKAAGHDEASSTEEFGTYTPEAKGAIQKMLGVTDIIATEENDLTASKAYAIGDIFVANGKLYKATAAIAQDATIILPDDVGANCEETNLADTITETKFINNYTPNSWLDVQARVRAGRLKKDFAVGDELVSTYTYNGVSYDCPWVVLDTDRPCVWEDGTTHPGLWIGMKYATIEDIQFDAAESTQVDLTEEPNALDGWYYWGVNGTSYTKINVSTGDALPTNYENVVKCGINSLDVLRYGYNRWSHSAYRQWLNSDAAVNEWWTAQHQGDIKPSQLATYKGFMAGLDSDFLSVITPVKIKTACNTVTDNGVVDETVDRFFLQSIEEVYGAPQIVDIEGPYFPYWKIETGLDEPENGSGSNTNDARKIRRINNPTGSAAFVRLRSCDRGYSNYVWYVYTSGALYVNYASNSNAALPACVIS